MNRSSVLLAALVVVLFAATGAFAAPQAEAPQSQSQVKPDLRAALEQAARQSARRNPQGTQSEAGGSENGANGGEDPAEAEEHEFAPDPAYEAQVAAVAGKKMSVTWTNAPPVIDGILNDPEWNFAEPITDFLQREPDNGQPGSQRTEVRMLYDGENIYFAWYMFDTEPDKIVATDLRRDSRLDTDDTMAVILDTFDDKRNGYLFRVNALATQYDAEVRNERDINSDWDERWEAATSRNDQGWFAEIKIPLKALRYRTGSHLWGIDFKREIVRRNEEINWANYRRGFTFNFVSQAGTLVGLRELSLTQRFRFQPYVTGSGSQYNITDTPRNEADGSLGVENFKVQLTSNMTADFTANTDFAQVEDDTERVNLSRFPLFFPEKREFFLESSSNFAFGAGGRGMGGPDVSLYHSRNIGLAGGNPVPMIYGAKLTGKIGGTTVGFVNAQTGDSNAAAIEDVEPGQNFTVLRLRQDIFERSSVGMIFTNAQGAGNYNRVAGVDASFRFFDYLSFGGDIAGVLDDSSLRADPEASNNPYTGRFAGGWNSDVWDISGSYQRVDRDFETDLGFLKRRNVAEQSYRLGWSPRPGFAPAIRQFRFSTNYNFLTDTAGGFLERSVGFNANASFQTGDRITFNVGQTRERLDNAFYVSYEDNIYVLPGDYDSTNYWVSFDSYNARKYSGHMRVSWGGYWNGKRTSYSPGLTARFNEKFTLSPSYSYNHVELPTGVFNTHTVTTRVTYNFNERWLTNSLVQYNSVSGRMSVYARLRYVISEIDSFYLVYKSSTLWDEVYDGVADHQVVAKMTYSVDF
ncbi:MAG: DUF5916 domain-containing protein [Acidobacteriota bacterium]|jgi:hypothetical protein